MSRDQLYGLLFAYLIGSGVVSAWIAHKLDMGQGVILVWGVLMIPFILWMRSVEMGL